MAPIFLFLSLILVRVTVSQIKLPTYASFPMDGKTEETQGPGSEATSEPKSDTLNLEKVREFEKMYKFCKEHMDLVKSSTSFAEICEYLICFVDENDPDCSIPVLDTDGPSETTLTAFNCASNPYGPGCWITTSSSTEGPDSSKTPTTIDPCIWNPWHTSCRSSITTEESDEVKNTTATMNNCVINPYDPGCWNRTAKATTGEPKGATTQIKQPEIETTTDKDRVATTDEVDVNCSEEYEWFCEEIRGLVNHVLNGTKVSSSSEHDVTTEETVPERVDGK
ncbi:hypothetical protein WR25_27189 [Diploscapter pachys]|uniref:G-protein coupled receptors family 2 profile 1 domain-containing protein n=1 Tax=Diploscapter pachys TaxID=2018661 RepID=A0A2A2L0B9_9BILA|nr:hypothetical protein WR25_27189 [Diploscapter pachys]